MQAVQQFPKLGECGRRSQRRSDAYVAIYRGVGDPRWKPANGSVGQLAENILSACELRTPFDAKPLTIQRVKRVVNSNGLGTMGIMFLARAAPAKAIWRRPSVKLPFSRAIECLYRETHVLLDELADAVAEGTRKQYMETLTTVPLLIIDDFGMRKLPHTAAEDLLEIVMRRYERASTLLTSNRPVEDWGKLLGDVASVSSMLDRMLHHGHVLKCGPRSWRTKAITTAPEKES